jgi:hypothetical protein
MYRRIQLTHNDLISGICFRAQPDEVADAWIDMKRPRRRINKKVRFYFTENGWKKYGKKVVAACIQTNTRFRVIAVEEHDVAIYYQDDIQVALYPKKRGRK